MAVIKGGGPLFWDLLSIGERADLTLIEQSLYPMVAFSAITADCGGLNTHQRIIGVQTVALLLNCTLHRVGHHSAT